MAPPGSSPQRLGRCQPTIQVGRRGDSQELEQAGDRAGVRADEQAPGVRVRAREAGVVADVGPRVHDVLRVAGARVGAHVVRHRDDAVRAGGRARRATAPTVPITATAARRTAATQAARADARQRRAASRLAGATSWIR